MNHIFASILIIAGLLILANNAGIPSWEIWSDLWRFWPAVLIIIGLQLALGRSKASKLLIIFLTFSIIIFILLYVYANTGALRDSWIEKSGLFRTFPTGSNGLSGRQAIVKKNTSKKLVSRIINIDTGINSLELNDDTTDDLFLLRSGDSEHSAIFDLDSRQDGDILIVDARIPDKGRLDTNVSGENIEYIGEIGKIHLPTVLNLKIGAGSGEVDLDSVILKKLDIDVGLGSAEVLLSGNAVPETADLKVGLGSVHLNIDKNIGLEVKYVVGLGSLRVNNRDINGNGTYKTDNFDKSQRRMKVKANIGLGSLTITIEN